MGMPHQPMHIQRTAVHKLDNACVLCCLPLVQQALGGRQGTREGTRKGTLFHQHSYKYLYIPFEALACDSQHVWG